MHDNLNHEPRALFLGRDGVIYPDTLMCSGVVPAELDGQPCRARTHAHATAA
jgi:hypothetical protein